MLTLNDEAASSASRLALAVHMYRRKRDGKLLARCEIFLNVRKPGL
jgi:hypothetical protein